jgi:putative Mn2+ efflux pump MntP
MDNLTLLGIAWALAMDAFAVSASVAASLNQVSGRQVFRLAWHFGFFQAAMFVTGWYAGAAVSVVITAYDHWIAFAVLFFLGIRMIRKSFDSSGKCQHYDPTRGWSLVALSVATSIDALMVGVSFGLVKLAIWIPALLIGLVALVLSVVGCHIGRAAASYLGRWAERLGGVALMAIGTRILVQHLSKMA